MSIYYKKLEHQIKNLKPNLISQLITNLSDFETTSKMYIFIITRKSRIILKVFKKN